MHAHVQYMHASTCRHTIIISVVDSYGHVHPIAFCDAPSHREIDWLKALNHTYSSVIETAPAGWQPKVVDECDACIHEYVI